MSTDVTAHDAKTKKSAYWFYGDLVIVHVRGAETDGRFCLLEFLQPAGEWTPLHVHKTSDQTQYVLEGELTVYLPGESFVAGPGECVYTPMNVPHTECVTSARPARLLDMNAPAGFDEFVGAAGDPAAELKLPSPNRPPPDVERLTTLAAEHEIEVLGPPGSLPSKGRGQMPQGAANLATGGPSRQNRWSGMNGRKRMVIQLVNVSIRPEQRDKWLELIRMNAVQTRAEEGCESYQISEDLETPNTFVIVERWASLEAQYEHFRAPEFGELMGALGDVLAGRPDVSINEVASTLTLDEALAAAGASG
jgi:quinol monooxygenase YgiN/mannose-6-phosphate isomerase-like protein (cupin superfamily)